jgi:hypothetical protein
MGDIPVIGVGYKNIENCRGKCETSDILCATYLFVRAQINIHVEITVGIK